MKRTFLALATVLPIALPMTALAAGTTDFTPYGKVNVSVNHEDTQSSSKGPTDKWTLESNSSRLGVKGKTELSEGLYAIYKAEFEVYVDTGSNGDGKTFKQRNIYVGLTGNYGTIFAGRHDTPLKLTKAKIDVFSDMKGADHKNWMSAKTRASNVINYTTPNFNGVAASLMTILNEGSEAEQTNGLADSLSGSVIYKNEGLYLALGADRNVKSGSFAKNVYLDTARLAASYKLSGLTVGAMLQKASEGKNFDLSKNGALNTGDKYDETSYLVSATYKIDKIKLKAQFGKGKQETMVSGSLVNQEGQIQVTSIGADYALAKPTKLFVYYTDKEVKNVTAATKADDKHFGLGIEHKF